MDLDFSDEQALLRRSVRGLCGKLCPIEKVRQLEHDGAGYSPELWGALAEAGFLGLRIDEAHGGVGLGCLELVVTHEELGRALIPSPHLESATLAARLIALAGSPQQQAALLPKIAGGAVIIPAWQEADGSASLEQVATTAERNGDRILINGAKSLVPFAAAADRLLVLALHPTEPDRTVIACVDPHSPDVVLTPQPNHASAPLFAVTLNHVVVAAEDCLGLARGVDDVWESAFQEALIAIAAYSVGAAERAREITTEYAKERRQFDRPIGSFQSIAHYLADRLVELQGARGLVYQAAWAADKGLPFARLAAMAKLEATAMFRRMSAVAVQVHGGLGFTLDADPQLFFRRAKHWQLMYGDPTWLEDRIADHVLSDNFSAAL